MATTGKVKFFNSKTGFGFIIKDDGTGDVYFNRASLRRDREYDPIEGDTVEFEIREVRQGPIAHRIAQVA